MSKFVRFALVGTGLFSASAYGATLTVGPDKSYATPSEAAAVAQDGDVIEIDAGDYVGDVAIWRANGLTLRGVGGLARLRADGRAAAGKAIWVIQGDGTTVESVAFSEASVPDRNGAGIRQEGADLTVRYCVFHDNENGILAGDNADSEIVVEYSEFAGNGYGDGRSHNIYINKVRRFTLRGSYMHQAVVGHQVKSRALENNVLYNRIMDESDGTSSYLIDLPNGGSSTILGNLLHQSSSASNGTLVAYGAEGSLHPESALSVIHNTFVNHRHTGTFVNNHTNLELFLQNNLFVGEGAVLSGPGEERSNWVTDSPGFVDAAQYDYRLEPSSPAVDGGEEDSKH